MDENYSPIVKEGDALSLQGYTLAIADDAAAWLSNELASGAFKVPEGYDVKGEVTSAALKLKDLKDKDNVPILSKCTRDSVLLFFKDMVAQNLSFVNDQCYAIPFGDTLTCMPSYKGEIAIFRDNFPGYDISANVIYKDDTCEYLTDTLRGFNYIENHRSSIENRDKGIVGAYGSIYDKETMERVDGCVMTWKEIQTSWAQSRSKATQEKFPVDMAKRTVFKKLTKLWNDTKPGNRTAMQVQAYRRNAEAEYDYTQTMEEKPKASSNLKGGAKFDQLVAQKEKAADVEARAEEIPF